jgi:hypothetical protein
LERRAVALRLEEDASFGDEAQRVRLQQDEKDQADDGQDENAKATEERWFGWNGHGKG